VHPLPVELANRGLRTSVFMWSIPWFQVAFARRVAARLGVGELRTEGRAALEILAVASQRLLQQRAGLIVLHWPDADVAGHEYGWMSPQYAAGARRLDAALGLLLRLVDVSDPRTLLIALADHGGGGRTPNHHDSDHPLDRTIPVILAGGAVQSGALDPGARIEDVPATILHALDLPRPDSFAGSVLSRTDMASQSAA
jgi:phosphopentomutase